MSIRKFFFDDARTPPSSEWVWAKDVKEAKAILATQAFDVMSLDHDIGMQMMCDQCFKDTVFDRNKATFEEIDKALQEKLRLGCEHMEHGTDLAKWMVSHLTDWPKLILIHSANPWGATRMYDLLVPDADVIVMAHHMIKYDTIKWEDYA